MKHVLSLIRAIAKKKIELNQFQTLANRESTELWLPPFLGEMGIEIQFFIPAIEPWTRTGWKVLTKRPELYPQGVGHKDTVLFSEISALSKEYNAVPIMSRLSLPSGASLRFQAHDHEGGIRSTLDVASDEFRKILRTYEFEKKLKMIVGNRILNANRPATQWDDYLTSIHNPYDDIALPICSQALLPSYKPRAFLEGNGSVSRHIGLQLRNYGDPCRNSNVEKVMSFVMIAKKLLGLPILCYGDKFGTVAPEGLQKTRDFINDEAILLDFELKALANCALMFAPDSGWCDLMAWLGVPTVLESAGKYTHRRLSVYRPKILALNQTVNFEADLLKFAFCAEHLPNDLLSTEEVPHPIYIYKGLDNENFF